MPRLPVQLCVVYHKHLHARARVNIEYIYSHVVPTENSNRSTTMELRPRYSSRRDPARGPTLDGMSPIAHLLVILQAVLKDRSRLALENKTNRAAMRDMGYGKKGLFGWQIPR